MNRAITAFTDSMKRLGVMVRDLQLDKKGLQRPLKQCDLAKCRGTCCHDGVYLNSEEAGVIRELVNESREDFESLGLDLPEQVVVYGRWRDVTSGPKTAKRPEPMHETVPDYPEHFADTNCVFLMNDARCGLQALAVVRGKHPWFYKPSTCWLHPLSIVSGEDGSIVLTLHSDETDPQRFDDYDGFVPRTHCGRTCMGGEPAYKALSGEIKMLGELGGRDLLGELDDSHRDG
jgi:hypothetical protein